MDPTAVGDIYMRALSLGEITAPKKQGKKGKEANGSASELVTLECAWASFLRRMQEAQAAEGAGEFPFPHLMPSSRRAESKLVPSGADSEDNVSASLRSAIERCKAGQSCLRGGQEFVANSLQRQWTLLRIQQCGLKDI